jgi:hypothetical protein
MRKLSLIGAFLLLVQLNLFAADSAKPQDFWKWYEKFPWMQDFYPVGLYGDNSSTGVLCSDMKQRIEMASEVFAQYNINTHWSTHVRFTDIEHDRNAWREPKINEIGKWYYGKHLPMYEIYSMTGFNHWMRYKTGVWKRHPEMARDFPVLTPKEYKTAEKDMEPIFRYGRFLRKNYPFVAGFITDDEPHYFAPATASIKMLEKNTGAPAVTCKPTFSGVMKFAKDVPAFTGDWYYHLNNGNSWLMAERLRKFNKTYPGKVFWFMTWTCASGLEGNEATLPGLRDSRITEPKLRLEVWQALALGTKGIWAFIPSSTSPGYRGQVGLVDTLLNPARIDDCMLEEYGRLGEMLNTIGPLLLSCYPEPESKVKVECGSYKNIFFKGPQIDHGILRDVTSTRFYIIPWNNNPDKKSSGRLVLPADEVKGKKVYDLNTLTEMKLTGNKLSINLAPGGGKVILVATPEQFEESKNRILKMQCRKPRVMVRPAYELAKTWRIDLAKADAVLAEAKAAEEKEYWVTAKEKWIEALNVIKEEEKKQQRFLLQIRWQLKKTSLVLSETEELLRCNIRLLDFPATLNHYPTFFSHKLIGKEVRTWDSIVRFYYEIQKNFRENNWHAGAYIYLAVAQSCYDIALTNQKKIKQIIENKRLAGRRAVKVAFITPDRIDIENYEVFAWFFDYSDIRWFSRDEKGNLVDRDNKVLRLSDFDSVWVHQLKSLDFNDSLEPAKALIPEIMTPSFKKDITSYVQSGKGLLLTGIAGLYAVELGIEKTGPDLVSVTRDMTGNMGVGVDPAPGYRNHPIFSGFKELGLLTEKTGFFTNGGGLCPQLTWKKNSPSGEVVANLKDVVYGTYSDHSVIVEYKEGKGKVVVIDSQTVDLTPARGYKIPVQKRDKHALRSIKDSTRFGFRERTRKLVLNTLSYLGSADKFKVDPAVKLAAEKLRQAEEEKRRNTVWLPKADWKFKLDAEEKGLQEGWYRKDIKTKGWNNIRIGQSWETQGYDYNGYAWYKRDIKLVNRPGMQTVLNFGAADEKAWVWLDGKEIGSADVGWDKPFSFDITDKLTEKENTYQITVRIHDHLAAGGLWKPIFVSYKKTVK